MFSVFSDRKCTSLICLLWVCQNVTNIYFLQRISRCHIRRTSLSLLWTISKGCDNTKHMRKQKDLQPPCGDSKLLHCLDPKHFKTAFKIFFIEKKTEEDGLCYLCKPLQRCHFCWQKISWKPSNFHLNSSTYKDSAVALVGWGGSRATVSANPQIFLQQGLQATRLCSIFSPCSIFSIPNLAWPFQILHSLEWRVYSLLPPDYCSFLISSKPPGTQAANNSPSTNTARRIALEDYYGLPTLRHSFPKGGKPWPSQPWPLQHSPRAVTTSGSNSYAEVTAGGLTASTAQHVPHDHEDVCLEHRLWPLQGISAKERSQ